MASTDLLVPGQPLWWLLRLSRKLRLRTARTDIYDDYFSGNHRLAFATPKFREAFGGLFNELADDWCGLIVDAVDERMQVTGFRIGVNAERGDMDAWNIWQVNKLDSGSRMGHVEALIREEAAAIVWFGDASTNDKPKITIESPSQVYVEFADSSRTVRAAALKLWLDDDGYEYATVYLPDFIYKYRSANKATAARLVNEASEFESNRPSGGAGTVKVGFRSGFTLAEAQQWVPREIATEAWPLSNPLGVVNVVPLTNRPRLGRNGESELRKVIPVQDAVNKIIADLLVASEFQSFQQRVLIGWDIPKDANGKPLPNAQLVQASSRLWATENKDAKVVELKALDLSSQIKAVEMFVQHIASQTRTPPHYFYLSGNFPSGESIKSAETGLVAKARTKMLHFGEAWEEVIRIAFAIMNDPRSKEYASETIWRDPESRTESEHIDAVTKKLALGVPQEQLWEDAGYSPQQIARFKSMLAEQQAAQMALALQYGLSGGTTDATGATATSAEGGTGPGAQVDSTEYVPGAPVQPVVRSPRLTV